MVEAVLLSAPSPPVLPQAGLPIAVQADTMPSDLPDFAAIMADGAAIPTPTLPVPDPALPPALPQVVPVPLPVAAPSVPMPVQMPPLSLPAGAVPLHPPAPHVAASPSAVTADAPLPGADRPTQPAVQRGDGPGRTENVTNMAETPVFVSPQEVPAPDLSAVETAAPLPDAGAASGAVPAPMPDDPAHQTQPVAGPAATPADATAMAAAALLAAPAAPPPDRAGLPARGPNIAMSAAPITPMGPVVGLVARADAAPSAAPQPARAAVWPATTGEADPLHPAPQPVEARNAPQAKVSVERAEPARIGTIPRGAVAEDLPLPKTGAGPSGIETAETLQTAPARRDGGAGEMVAGMAPAGGPAAHDHATTLPQRPPPGPEGAPLRPIEPLPPPASPQPEASAPAAWTVMLSPAGRAEVTPALPDPGAWRVDAAATEVLPASPDPMPAPSVQPLQPATASPVAIHIPPAAAPQPPPGIDALPIPFSAMSEPVPAPGPAPDAPEAIPASRPVPVESLPALLLAQADGRPAEIHLEPLDLGRLRFDVVAEGQEVQVTLAAERSDTADLLRRHAAELEAEFRQAGFLQVTIGFGTWAGSRGQSRTPPGPAATADAPVQAAQAAQLLFSPQARPVAGRGLHLRL